MIDAECPAPGWSVIVASPCTSATPIVSFEFALALPTITSSESPFMITVFSSAIRNP